MPSSGTISQIQLPNGNIYDIASNGKTVWYGKCSTASSTANKVITTTTGDFELEDGNILFVLFTGTNSVAHPYFVVDGNTAVSVALNDDNYAMAGKWSDEGVVVGFIYDDNQECFYMLYGTEASTNSYGITKLSNLTSSSSIYEAATPYAVKQAYDLANTKSKVQIVRW